MLRSIARGVLRLAISVAAAAIASAQTGEKLGSVSFPNTCSDAVQPKLQRAVALLHSFWWSEGGKALQR